MQCIASTRLSQYLSRLVPCASAPERPSNGNGVGYKHLLALLLSVHRSVLHITVFFCLCSCAHTLFLLRVFLSSVPNDIFKVRGARARVADERERRRVRALEELHPWVPIGLRVDRADGRGRQGDYLSIDRMWYPLSLCDVALWICVGSPATWCCPVARPEQFVIDIVFPDCCTRLTPLDRPGGVFPHNHGVRNSTPLPRKTSTRHSMTHTLSRGLKPDYGWPQGSPRGV